MKRPCFLYRKSRTFIDKLQEFHTQSELIYLLLNPATFFGAKRKRAAPAAHTSYRSCLFKAKLQHMMEVTTYSNPRLTVNHQFLMKRQ